MKITRLTLTETGSVSDEIAMEFRKFDLTRVNIAAGTNLFHGTDRPASEWNPAQEPIWGPAWFSETPNIAQSYAGFRRSGSLGDPIVLIYKLTDDISVLDVSGEEISGLMDELYGNYTNDDIAIAVCELGFDGWLIQNEEVMICDTDVCRFLGYHSG